MEAENPRKINAAVLRCQNDAQQAMLARDRAQKEVQMLQIRCTSLEKSLQEQTEAYRKSEGERRQRHEHELQQLSVQLLDAQYERERLEKELEEFKLRFTNLELAIQRRLTENDQRLQDQATQSSRQLKDQQIAYEHRLSGLQQRLGEAEMARVQAERNLIYSQRK